MLFAIGTVSTFITGQVTGLILGDSALDINVHDTYFVVGHFHIVSMVKPITKEAYQLKNNDNIYGHNRNYMIFLNLNFPFY